MATNYFSGLDAKLPEEFAWQSSCLKNKGIDEVRIGFELEVPMRPLPLDAGNKYYKERQNYLADKALSEDEKKRIKSLKNANEIFYEDVMQEFSGKLSPPTVGRIEDNAGVLEFRSVPADPQSAVELHKRLTEIVKEKALMYGLDDVMTLQPQSTHVNASLYKGGKNLVNPLNQEFHTTGSDIIRGMGRAVFDSSPTYLSWERGDKHSIYEKELPAVDIGPSRMQTLRLAGYGDELSRVQLMLPPDNGFGIGMIVSNLIAGAISAMDETNKTYVEKNVLPAVQGQRPFMQYKSNDDYTLGYVSHMINGSTIGKNGKLQSHLPYILSEAEYHAGALGVPVTSNQEALAKKIAGIIDEIKIVDNAGGTQAIKWPERKLSQSTIQRLNAGIELGKIVPTMATKDGYTLTSRSNTAPDIFAERIERMKNSQMLQKGHSVDFGNKQQEILGEFDISGAGQRLYQDSENQIAKGRGGSSIS